MGNESDPGVAYNAGGYLVTLTGRRCTGDPDVRAVRYNSAGARLDGDPFVIEGATNENDQPAVSPGRAGGWGIAYEHGTGPQTAVRWRHAE